MTEDTVILVNEQDEEIGSMDKLEVHRKAILHRAFSVFIFNEKGEMLLQRRALNKYHSGGLWTNACCSHPRPGETVEGAAARRLVEELGFSTDLHRIFSFLYKAPFDNGLTEHEYDHVFIGQYSGLVHPNPDEVGDFCYKQMDSIRDSLESHPHKYTEWFKIAFPMLESHLQQRGDLHLSTSFPG